MPGPRLIAGLSRRGRRARSRTLGGAPRGQQRRTHEQRERGTGRDTAGAVSSARRRTRTGQRLRERGPSYLQHGHLLPVAEQPEGQGVPGVQPRDHLAATEGDGHEVGLQVGPVLVQDELVVLDPAPALPPAVVGEHGQVACGDRAAQLGERRLCVPKDTWAGTPTEGTPRVSGQFPHTGGRPRYS